LCSPPGKKMRAKFCAGIVTVTVLKLFNRLSEFRPDRHLSRMKREPTP
jgi:hypothetical protein